MTNDKKKKISKTDLIGFCATSAFSGIGVIEFDDNDEYAIVVHIYDGHQVGKKSRCKIRYDGRYYAYILTGRQKYFLDEFERTIPLF